MCSVHPPTRPLQSPRGPYHFDSRGPLCGPYPVARWALPWTVPVWSSPRTLAQFACATRSLVRRCLAAQTVSDNTLPPMWFEQRVSTGGPHTFSYVHAHQIQSTPPNVLSTRPFVCTRNSAGLRACEVASFPLESPTSCCGGGVGGGVVFISCFTRTLAGAHMRTRRVCIV